ncbi:MAG: UDP-N-acetylmuramate--L-alanine ligase [Deltaproteobacteria bacterium]|nr:UDP-N-acetylmuramate--L-alanine ligase [Deltaproteobacteria bacterium]
MYRKEHRIHFVGVGGSGMSGIAEVLVNLGYRVSGSDLADNDVTRRLAGLGITVSQGHDAKHVIESDAQVVVVSTAVKKDNPEVVEARRRGIPVIPRAEMLAELMRVKYGVAIAGSHGKTTTTSLTAAVLQAGGLDPTVVIGGRLVGQGTGARLGKGEFLVAEADESDGSFLHLAPTIAAVTNIDREHLDHHHTMEKLREAFVTFVNKVPFYGLAILNLDHPVVQGILPEIEKRWVTYGFSAQADYTAVEVELAARRSSFVVRRRGEDLGAITLGLAGLHNVQNSLAVVAIADELGIPFAAVRDALASFEGIERRFQILGEEKGVLVVDDYGHHPAEIRATLEAARAGWGRRIVVAFQPHRYTRTRDLADEFHGAFHQSDVLLVTSIYAASEEPIPGVSGETVAEGARLHGHRDVRFVPTLPEVVDTLAAVAREGDLVITLGAGSIGGIGPKLLARLRGEGT